LSNSSLDLVDIVDDCAYLDCITVGKTVNRKACDIVLTIQQNYFIELFC